MTQLEFQQMLVNLMKQGLVIDMFMEGEVVWFDMNTNMKSHLHISHDQATSTVAYRARYNESGTIISVDDLFDTVRSCLQGREYGSPAWHGILGGW